MKGDRERESEREREGEGGREGERERGKEREREEKEEASQQASDISLMSNTTDSRLQYCIKTNHSIIILGNNTLEL